MPEHFPLGPEEFSAKKPQQPEQPDLGRREFIKKLAVGAATMAFGNNLAKVEKLFAGNSGSVSEHGAEANLSTDNKEVNKKHTYKTGALEGQSFHGLYHDYTGISGRVPAEV